LRVFRKLPTYSAIFLGVVLLLFSLFRIYYIFTGPLDLSPDEAQYWDWSRRLALSYYSKGPAIAYIIALGSSLLGNTEIGVRIPAVFFSLCTSIVLYYLGRDIADNETLESSNMPKVVGLVSALLIQISPIFSTYGIIMTIDSPFMFFWSLSLYLFYLVQKKWNKTKKVPLWLWSILGFTVGIGLLVKYTMAFFYLSIFLYLVTDKKNRSLFLQPALYFSFFISLLCFLPVLIWNSQHNWVTFLHTAGHIKVSDGMTLNIGDFFEFIGSQLGIITPVVFIFVIISLFRLRKEVAYGSLLFWFSIPILFFFSMKSLQGKVQANWTLPAYIAGFVSLSIYTVKYWKDFKRSVKTLLVIGGVLSFSVSAIAYYPSILNLPSKLDPTSKLKGWEQLGKEISKVSEEMEPPYFIFSDNYQVSSELAFYVDKNPVTYCINLGRRMNQYDIWPGFYNFKGYNAIFVRTGHYPFPEKLRTIFEECTERLYVQKEKQKIVRKYDIFQCYMFKGMKKESAHEF